MKKFFLVFLALAIVLGLAKAYSTPAASGLKKELPVLSRVATMIQSGYVGEVTDATLFEGAMEGMVGALDPYSQFLDREDYSALMSETQGQFAGVGLEISVKGGVLHVICPLDDSPASRAGIHPRDVIIKIDGQFSKDLSLGEAVRRLRGKPGSSVTLTLLRDGASAPLELSLTRELLRVQGVREIKFLDGNVGYIRVAEFQKKTAQDFADALTRIRDQKAPGLVIDLRNNPGGLLDGAVKVSEFFVPKGQTIVSTRGRLAEKNKDFISANTEPVTDLKVAILVNHGSASGSEIFAGAMQDHGLGRVFGQKTYGKGCVQTLTPLPDGSAVRITTSHYFTPKGRVIHEVGVTPDVEIPETQSGQPDLSLAAATQWILSA